MKKSLIKTTAAFGFALLALNVYADQNSSMKKGSMEMGASKGASLGTNEAVVQGVDKAGKAVTLKHGPLKSKTVEMPAMTMTFAVENASFLSAVKEGDKVKVTIENVENQPTVTALTVQK
ncbi:copper-binding protein [Noviherbaspirillum soli]|uniref:copper-binding protein n=1 Tax=Noviherbaspirillum soli TaxID=1064518 RepID=UPI00188C8F4F|nr:copper-binding protein [Noviherbaspirillum soli]